MKRFVSVCLAVSVAVGIATASSGLAQAAPEKFSNCKEFNKRYDGGVAIDDATSRKFYQAGWYYPAVGKAMYLANKKLDKEKNGIVCERWNKKNGPTPVNPNSASTPNPSASPSASFLILPSGNFFVDAFLEGLANTGQVNQPEVTYLWVVLSTFESDRSFCTAYKDPALKESLLGQALSDQQLTKQGVEVSRKDVIRGFLTTLIPRICA